MLLKENRDPTWEATVHSVCPNGLGLDTLPQLGRQCSRPHPRVMGGPGLFTNLGSNPDGAPPPCPR